ncbi:hypothetical protein JTB14_026505 [Gonioctena quinquepunctata]|nr:hypothetical protein JTB14_026505 [Gonioctena quinquepunctata]
MGTARRYEFPIEASFGSEDFQGFGQLGLSEKFAQFTKEGNYRILSREKYGVFLGFRDVCVAQAPSDANETLLIQEGVEG